MSDPPLDGPAIEALTQAIEGAFTVAELEALILFTFSKGLYIEYVPEGLTGRYTTFLLLQALKQRGTVAQFLRAICKARPQNLDLLVTIRRTCPSAMQDSPRDQERVEDVCQGLKTLRALQKDNSNDVKITAHVRASREELKELASGLQTLQAYKILHDTLQKVQVKPYKLLIELIRKLRTEPTAASALRGHLAELGMLCEDARQGVEGLPDIPRERKPELRWIGTLETALRELRKAVQELDDMGARLAVSSITDVIGYDPARVNGLLRDCAESLPLDSLIETFSRVSKICLNDDKAQVFDAAIGALENLWSKLGGTVTQHDHWQDVETQLWGADMEIERGERLGDFILYWKKAKPKIGVLWGLDPSAAWISDAEQFSREIDTAVNADPVDFVATTASYGLFRVIALTEFYIFDNKLRRLCGEVLKISRPLVDILDRLDS